MGLRASAIEAIGGGETGASNAITATGRIGNTSVRQIKPSSNLLIMTVPPPHTRIRFSGYPSGGVLLFRLEQPVMQPRVVAEHLHRAVEREREQRDKAHAAGNQPDARRGAQHHRGDRREVSDLEE